MSVPAPHFVLDAQAAVPAGCDDSSAPRWRFLLRAPDQDAELEAADEEPAAGIERLELLAVVRGLEALEQPSRVTLHTASRHVRRGLDGGLSEWRENDWHWERYGRMTPIKNGDLWRRLDRLISIHTIDCPGGPVRKADDLTPPPPITTRTGKKLRIDNPSPRRGKHQATSTKIQTNSNAENANDRNSGGFGHSNICTWCLIEFWCLLFGALKSQLEHAFTTVNANTGTPRAHDRYPRRHERPACRTSGPPRRRPGAADDSARRA